MTSANFPATLERQDVGDSTKLIIQGALDEISTEDLRSGLEAIIHEDRREVVLDLSRLTLVTSSGVDVLVKVYKAVTAQPGGQVYIVGLCGQPLAIFKLLRLDRMLGDISRSR